MQAVLRTEQFSTFTFTFFLMLLLTTMSRKQRRTCTVLSCTNGHSMVENNWMWNTQTFTGRALSGTYTWHRFPRRKEDHYHYYWLVTIIITVILTLWVTLFVVHILEKSEIHTFVPGFICMPHSCEPSSSGTLHLKSCPLTNNLQLKVTSLNDQLQSSPKIFNFL